MAVMVKVPPSRSLSVPVAVLAAQEHCCCLRQYDHGRPCGYQRSDAHLIFPRMPQMGASKYKNQGQMKCLPVAPKPFLRENSHIPARSWARPPQKMAMPRTTLGWDTSRIDIVQGENERYRRKGEQTLMKADRR